MTAFSCAMLLNRPCIVLKSSHCSIKLFMIGVFEIKGWFWARIYFLKSTI
ncbi:hypothetical protein HPHPA5_0239 [Helicobacter pylori Hp A-5]|nr:hypothetical protein HPHPA5_0239 [Helicobacter pylori Hp A-5]